jgi:chemotaxis family two-component system sensor kinase Cph1
MTLVTISKEDFSKEKRLLSDLELFRYVLSHDLKKPLRLASYHCQIIKEDDVDAKTYISNVEAAIKQTQVMLNYVEEYLLCELYTPEITNFSVELVLSEAKLASKVENNMLMIVADKLPIINSSYKYLKYIFKALIDNAINFCQLPTPELRIYYEEKDNFYYFTFINNAVKISEDYWEIVFVLFQRLHTQEEVAGDGVGLALSKKMSQCLGGEMWIEECSGMGNKFMLKIPITF